MSKRILALLSMTLAMGCAASSALAQQVLPPNETVRMMIHDNPANPLSPVRFSYEVTLVAMDTEEDMVKWKAESLYITRFDENEDPIESWVILEPAMETGDGYWHVEHANPQEPMQSEFLDMPETFGVATPMENSGDYLEFSVRGRKGPTEATRPYQLTSFLDYYFWRLSDPTPIDEDDDKPAEADEDSGSAD